MGDEGQKWYETLEGDFKSNPSIIKFENVGALAKSYVELEKTLGKDKIVIPTDKSSAEEISSFWKKLGAPEKEEDYDIGDEDLPEPIRTSNEEKAALRKRAKELGIPKKQFDELVKQEKKLRELRFNQAVERVKNMKGATEKELREAWGAAYDAKVANAQKLLDQFGKGKKFSKEFIDILKYDRGYIEMMADIADNMSEDKFKGGSNRTTLTPEEAQSELNEIIGNKKGPYYDNLHPEHEAMVTKVLELQQLITAGQGQ